MDIPNTVRRSLIGVFVAGACAVAGCSSNGGNGAAATSTASSSSSGGQTPSAASVAPTSATPQAGPGPDADLATTTFPVDLDRAVAVANQTVPGGVITKIELDFDRGANAWVWKIDAQQNTDQRELKIDAQSARVVADDRDQESANPVAVDPQKLPPGDALSRAVALQPGSVAKWALEFDDGVQRYAIDVRMPDGTTKGIVVNVDSGAARPK